MDKIIDNINKYRETFHTPVSVLADMFGVHRSQLSSILNKSNSIVISDNVKNKIINGFNKLPTSIEF